MNNSPVPIEIIEALDYLQKALAATGNFDLVTSVKKYRATLPNELARFDAIHHLALIAMQVPLQAVADLLFRYALSLNDRSPQMLYNRGVLLRSMGMHEKAITSYKRALDITPTFSSAYIGVAEILRERKRSRTLVKWLEDAIIACPDNPDLLILLGEAVKIAGDPETAIHYFRKALKLAPENAYIYQTIAHTKKFISHDADVQAIEAFYSRKMLETEQKIRLGFSLGKIFEDLKDYRRSFHYYKAANDTHRSTYSYSTDSTQAFFRSVVNSFSNEIFEKYSFAGFKSDEPIFIVGMPRSGTTLVEQMLASHRDVYGAGELGVMQNIVTAMWQSTAVKDTEYPFGIDNIPTSIFSEAGRHYVNSVRQLSQCETTARITDKMPHNFMFVGLIKLILPNARVIHCRRGPVDTCFSIYKHFFSGSHGYAYELSELGSYYQMYDRLMTHWHDVLPGFVCDINYESLVDNPRKQIKKMLNFCDLPWDDACMRYYESDNVAVTASSTQVKQPIHKDALQYWERYKEFLGPLLEELTGAGGIGY